MVFLRYLAAELGRRRGRTLLTALGLGVGVGLVVAVAALSDGIERAQEQVLRPLTGVGTDLSATRPVNLDRGLLGISKDERERLEEENGAFRVQLTDLGKPGDRFERTEYISVAQLSFPEAVVQAIRTLPQVSEVAGALTLNSVSATGIVPEIPEGAGPQLGGAPPEDLDLRARSVTGVDLAAPGIAAITPGQVTRGRYLRTRREVVLGEGFAQRENLRPGDTLRLGRERFDVVGIARSPLGGASSDVYMELARLQRLSDRRQRINVVQLRARDAGSVRAVAAGVRRLLPGASVTTAQQLADRVGGSVTDARELSDKLGTALSAVALVAALLIASLLTLSGVAKRTRELGTLKAIGWPQRLVVRQLGLEAVAVGLLGGLFGAGVGVGAVALIDAVGIELQATVAAVRAPSLGGPAGGGGGGGGDAAGAIQSIFGQGGVQAGSRDVTVDAQLDSSLLLAAAGLALLVGLLSGATGALRAARLRPADALRSVE